MFSQFIANKEEFFIQRKLQDTSTILNVILPKCLLTQLLSVNSLVNVCFSKLLQYAPAFSNPWLFPKISNTRSEAIQDDAEVAIILHHNKQNNMSKI